MKLTFAALKQLPIAILLFACLNSCDEDFVSVDSDIINQNAAHFTTQDTPYDVITYTRQVGPVQTNNLPSNLLGVFNDNLYGKTTASVVSQLTISTFNPNFGNNVEVDSVVMTVPYFSRAISTGEDGTVYELDSVYGDAPIRLSLYESKYFLRDYDPLSSDINAPQPYYSNGATGADVIPETLLKGVLIDTFPNFSPDNEELVIYDADSVETRLSPALRLNLSPDFWRNKIIDAEQSTVLSNTNNFKDYFRGIYFQAESETDNGNLSLLNFDADNANITIFYSKDADAESPESRTQSRYVLSFGGNRFNILSPVEYEYPVPNETEGDERIYLKGGQGSVGIVELFGGTDVDDDPGLNQFEQFKNDFVFTDENGNFVKPKRLINQANLIFYVDQDLVTGNEPERIYLYDSDNNIPLFDFTLDVSINVAPIDSRSNHLGRLERLGGDPDAPGVRYKILVTEHLKNLLYKDSTNVSLGLAVSSNVNLEGAIPQADVLDSDDFKVPVSSLVTPRSTVLYGNKATDPEKRVYLEVYYTEPEN